MNNLDQVILVDSDDQEIGQMDKVDAHRGEAKLHRAISVYLFRRMGERENSFPFPLESGKTPSETEWSLADRERRSNIGESEIQLLIQQRSAQKIVGAGMWANTVCGNVRPGESYEECAYRRLREELGIKNPLPLREGASSLTTGRPDKSGTVTLVPLYKFEYHLQCNPQFSEWEMDQVFVGWYDGVVTPNPEEVQNYAWVSWDELLQQNAKVDKDPHDFNTKEVTLTTHNSQPTTYPLAPWFVWMLEDPQLQDHLQPFLSQ